MKTILYVAKAIVICCMFIYPSIDMYAMKKRVMQKHEENFSAASLRADFEDIIEKKQSKWCNKYVIGTVLVANTCIYGITGYLFYSSLNTVQNDLQTVQQTLQGIKQTISGPIIVEFPNVISGNIIKK